MVSDLVISFLFCFSVTVQAQSAAGTGHSDHNFEINLSAQCGEPKEEAVQKLTQNVYYLLRCAQSLAIVKMYNFAGIGCTDSCLEDGWRQD